jgi:Antitoxin MazE-like
MRPVQIWLPDTRNPKFAAECRRQSLLVKKSEKNNKLIEAWEKTADRTGWV